MNPWKWSIVVSHIVYIQSAEIKSIQSEAKVEHLMIFWSDCFSKLHFPGNEKFSQDLNFTKTHFKMCMKKKHSERLIVLKLLSKSKNKNTHCHCGGRSRSPENIQNKKEN